MTKFVASLSTDVPRWRQVYVLLNNLLRRNRVSNWISRAGCFHALEERGVRMSANYERQIHNRQLRGQTRPIVEKPLSRSCSQDNSYVAGSFTIATGVLWINRVYCVVFSFSIVGG